MKQYKTAVITLIVLVGILLLAYWFITQLAEREAAQTLANSEAARSLSNNASSTPYTDFSGNTANLESHLGQVVVVTSWASWSPASQTELQLLAEVVSSYQADVVVLAINRSEPRTTAEAFLETIGVSDSVRLIVDTDDRYYSSIGGYTMPETVFYDQTGSISAHQRGPISAAQARYNIDQALQIKSVNTPNDI